MENYSTVLSVDRLKFAANTNTCSQEHLQEWLCFLDERNTRVMEDDCEFKDFWCTSKIVELVFKICRKFKEPAEVRYTSVEILDRFVVQHVKDLQAEMAKNQKVLWEDVEERLKNQLLLRAVSCVQLASKLCSHYEAVSAQLAKEFLKTAGSAYSLQNILCSELRVLRTLNYKIAIVTPLTYIEALIEILAFNTNDVTPSEIYPIVVQLLDFFYIRRDGVYLRIYRQCVGDPEAMISSQCVDEFRVLKSDYFFLSAALIFTAGGLVSDELQDVIGEQFTAITAIKRKDMEDFYGILISEIEEDVANDAI